MTKENAIFARRIFGPFIPHGSVTIGNSATYYQTAEAKGEHVAWKYRAYRARGYGAAEAFRRALARPAIYESGFSDGYGVTAALGAPWDSAGRHSTRLQWAERPAALGFRFAGYADELARLDHKGWFNRDDCEESTFRGAVWRLPHGRLVPGMIESDNPDAAALALGEVMREAKGGEDSDTLRDAARRADSIAEYAAEDSRAHDAAYQRGARAARRIERAAEARREALALLAEMRAAGRKGRAEGGPICRALRKALDAALETIETARAKRESAWADCPSWLEDDWRDGYCTESSVAGWNAFAMAIRRPALRISS